MSKKTRQKIEPVDTGSELLHRHHTIVPRYRPQGYHMQVVDETEIDRMLLADKITLDQHATLERFLGKLHASGVGRLKSPDYSSPVYADASAVGDHRAHVVRALVSLMSVLVGEIGEDHRIALVALVLEDRPWSSDLRDIKEIVAALDRVMSQPQPTK